MRKNAILIMKICTYEGWLVELFFTHHSNLDFNICAYSSNFKLSRSHVEQQPTQKIIINIFIFCFRALTLFVWLCKLKESNWLQNLLSFCFGKKVAILFCLIIFRAKEICCSCFLHFVSLPLDVYSPDCQLDVCGGRF